MAGNRDLREGRRRGPVASGEGASGQQDGAWEGSAESRGEVQQGRREQEHGEHEAETLAGADSGPPPEKDGKELEAEPLWLLGRKVRRPGCGRRKGRGSARVGCGGAQQGRGGGGRVLKATSAGAAGGGTRRGGGGQFTWGLWPNSRRDRRLRARRRDTRAGGGGGSGGKPGTEADAPPSPPGFPVRCASRNVLSVLVSFSRTPGGRRSRQRHWCWGGCGVMGLTARGCLPGPFSVPPSPPCRSAGGGALTSRVTPPPVSSGRSCGPSGSTCTQNGAGHGWLHHGCPRFCLRAEAVAGTGTK